MLADDEINDFVNNQKAKATAAKTKCDVGVFSRWMEVSCPDEQRDLQDISPTQLNSSLRNFYLTVRKSNGEEYEPDTLVGFKNSIDRYLFERGYSTSACRGDEFKSSRSVLIAKGKQLKKDGKGRKPHRAEELSEEEEKVNFSLDIDLYNF